MKKNLDVEHKIEFNELKSILEHNISKRLFSNINKEKIQKKLKDDGVYSEVEILTFKDLENIFTIINLKKTDIIMVKKTNNKGKHSYYIDNIKDEYKNHLGYIYRWIGKNEVTFKDELWPENNELYHKFIFSKNMIFLEKYLEMNENIKNIKYSNHRISSQIKIKTNLHNISINISMKKNYDKDDYSVSIGNCILRIIEIDEDNMKDIKKELYFIKNLVPDLEDKLNMEMEKLLKKNEFKNIASMITWLKLNKYNLDEDRYNRLVR